MHMVFFRMLQMLFEQLPAVIVLDVQAAQVIDTGLETVLFDRCEQFVPEGVDTGVETLRREVQTQWLGGQLH